MKAVTDGGRFLVLVRRDWVNVRKVRATGRGVAGRAQLDHLWPSMTPLRTAS